MKVSDSPSGSHSASGGIGTAANREKTKEGLAALGIVCIAGLFVALAWHSAHKSPKLPPGPPELLPNRHETPASDGSYPAFIIRRDSSPSKSAGLSVSYAYRQPTLRFEAPEDQFEVDLSTGKFVVRQTDLFVQDSIPLSLTRTFNSFDNKSRAFGIGWSQPYDLCPVGTRFPYTYLDLIFEDGNFVHFDRISKGTGFADAVYEHDATSSKEFYGARISWNGWGWNMVLPGGRVYVFPEAYAAKTLAQGAVKKIVGANNDQVLIEREQDGNINQIVAPSGRRIVFQYDGAQRITEARDDSGVVRKYYYDPSGCLERLESNGRVVYQFVYDRTMLTSIRDGADREILSNSYRFGRISEQRLATGAIYLFRYVVDSSNNVVESSVLQPDGTVKSFHFRQGSIIR
jgi:YD repeat-containing protein